MRAFAEFSWSSQAHAELDTAQQQHIQNDRATMPLKFEYVFTGE